MFLSAFWGHSLLRRRKSWRRWLNHRKRLPLQKSRLYLLPTNIWFSAMHTCIFSWQKQWPRGRYVARELSGCADLASAYILRVTRPQHRYSWRAKFLWWCLICHCLGLPRILRFSTHLSPVVHGMALVDIALYFSICTFLHAADILTLRKVWWEVAKMKKPRHAELCQAKHNLSWRFSSAKFSYTCIGATQGLHKSQVT